MFLNNLERYPGVRGSRSDGSSESGDIGREFKQLSTL